jgi:hypothetical protein
LIDLTRSSSLLARTKDFENATRARQRHLAQHVSVLGGVGEDQDSVDAPERGPDDRTTDHVRGGLSREQLGQPLEERGRSFRRGALPHRRIPREHPDQLFV